MDAATIATWHDFYITTATASASLLGLLFVAVSLNLEIVVAQAAGDLRAFSEQAFISFAVVLLMSLFFLIPGQDASVLAAEYVVLAAGAGYRLARRTPTVWRARTRSRLGAVVLWRFGLPLAATIGLLVAAVLMARDEPDALYWLVWVVVALLLSAARSSWDLLVRVGEERGGKSQGE